MSGLLVLRVLGLCYSLYVLQLAVGLSKSPFFKFLTHWGILLVAVYHFVAVLSHVLQQAKTLAHALFVTSWAVQFMICVVFWTWIEPMLSIYIPPVFNYSAHGGLLLMLALELPANSVVFRWSDIRYSLALLVLYQILNVYYTAKDGPVYPGLNYSGIDSVVLIAYSIAVYVGSYYGGVVLTKSRGQDKRD